MNEWLKTQIIKWLGIDLLIAKWFVHNSTLARNAQEINMINGTQQGQLMLILELERQVSELKPQRDSRGRFSK